jgi:hypothetical protein
VRSPRGARSRGLVAAGAVVLASVVAFLVACELLLRWSVPHLPLRYHKYLHGEVFALAQRSKRGLLPHDYVALFGDSYAQGVGDWYAAAVHEDWGEGAPYQAAHVLFDATGRDVISFGAAGASSFEGLVFFPLRLSAKLAARGIELEPPAQIVAYFYEGNDLTDNLALLRRHWPSLGQPPSGSGEVTQDLGRIIAFLEALMRRHRWRLEQPLRLRDRLYLSRFAAVLYGDLRRMAKAWLVGERASALPPTPVHLGGARLDLPEPLEAPAMELSAAEVDRALLVSQAALALNRRHFALIPLLLVYVPSPVAVYRLAAERVPIETTDGRPRFYASTAIERRSDRICAAVAEIAAAVGVDFLDARPVLRAIAQDRPVHGPGDWGHLNRTGYEALGRAIAGALEKEPGDGRCRPRAPVATAGR